MVCGIVQCTSNFLYFFREFWEFYWNKKSTQQLFFFLSWVLLTRKGSVHLLITPRRGCRLLKARYPLSIRVLYILQRLSLANTYLYLLFPWYGIHYHRLIMLKHPQDVLIYSWAHRLYIVNYILWCMFNHHCLMCHLEWQVV